MFGPLRLFSGATRVLVGAIVSKKPVPNELIRSVSGFDKSDSRGYGGLL